MSLWDWLKAYVDPAHKALTPEIAEAASLHCYAESVLAGHHVGDGHVAVHGGLGGRRPRPSASGPRSSPTSPTSEGYDYFETHRDRTDACSSPTAPPPTDGCAPGSASSTSSTARPSASAAAVDLAEEFDTGIHTHSSESIWEVQESLKRFGRRPIEVFHDRGILGPRTVVAHCVWLDDREIELLRADGHVGRALPVLEHEAGVGSGAHRRDARAPAWRSASGSDGEKENNNLDLVEEMKFASLLQKVSTLDPTTGDPWDILAMATIDGRPGPRPRRRHRVAGAGQAGRRRDRRPAAVCTPRRCCTVRDFNVAAHLVFSASGRDVRDVWVDGRRLVADGAPTTFDVATRARATAQAAAEELFARRAALAEGDQGVGAWSLVPQERPR